MCWGPLSSSSNNQFVNACKKKRVKQQIQNNKTQNMNQITELNIMLNRKESEQGTD